VSDEADSLKVIEGAKDKQPFWQSKLAVIGVESLKPEHKDVDVGVTFLAPGDDEDKELSATVTVKTDKIGPAIRGFTANLEVSTSKGRAFAKVPFLGTPRMPDEVISGVADGLISFTLACR